MGGPGFWDDAQAARKVIRRLNELKKPLEELESLERQLSDIEVLLELGMEEGDSSVISEIEANLKSLLEGINTLRLEILLNGPYDTHDAILSVHPGAGGTESQDWAEMLMRMYLRWAERRGYQAEVLDLLEGEEAGIKSAVISIKGSYAYGFLKAEKGVHRLVRISPFDAQSRRHTSFASVDVLPQVEEDEGVEIKPEEIRVDTFRASGAGGQHVNKTESAIRITHLPTGVVVSCQAERSQHANRETAMRILRARLAEMREAEREKELASLRGEQTDIAWGHQIRSYVFCPYTMVKDHRTGVEVGNVQGVMEGDVDRFIYTFLERKARGGAQIDQGSDTSSRPAVK